MSTDPDDKTTPAQPLPDPNANWWSSDPWYDQPNQAGNAGGSGQDDGSGGGAGGNAGGGFGGAEPTLPFGPPEPTQFGDSTPTYGEPAQTLGFGQGPYSNVPDDQPPFLGYPPQQPPRPPSHSGRNFAAIAGAVGVITTLIVVLVVTGSHNSSTSASSTGSPTPIATDTDTAQPTDTSTGDALPTDTGSTYTLPTIATFDPTTMNDSSTDTAPFTTDALLPNTFTDSKNVEYQLAAGGVETCVEDSMSSNVQDELRKYGCTQVLTGSYTVDSSPAATSDDDILVSVQVFAFNDASTAQTVYADFPSSKSWDFGIWCPKTGDGANPCSTNADYTDAYKSEWISQDYRYVIEATALYTDLTQDSSVQEWTSAAAKEAVNDSGPAYYITNQD
jgi:hypothetical protein